MGTLILPIAERQMPKAGYRQTPEHIRKRAEALMGHRNPSWKDGRRSYRRIAGANPYDGSVVHHLNGDRTHNHPENLQKLTDGTPIPGRKTTPYHEKITPRRRKNPPMPKTLERSAAFMQGYWGARDW